MNHRIRSTAALLMSAALVMTGSSALAASANKNATAQPTLKISTPSDGVSGGSDVTLIVTPNMPGFITVHVLNAVGSEVATPLLAYEVHTKDNELTFKSVDAYGMPLDQGSYKLCATITSQYGVTSKEVSASLSLEKPLDSAFPIVVEPTVQAAAVDESSDAAEDAEDEDTGSDSDAAEDTEDDSDAAKDAGASTAPSASTVSAGAASAPSSGAKTPVASADAISYAAGSGSIGEEGLLIGVGVSDTADQKDAGYWTLTSDSTDAEIWAAIIRPMTSVDVGESESAYIYDSTSSDRKKLGVVSGLSQGLNVITERTDGWSLVEAYRNDDGAFVRGYVKTNKLRTVEPNQNYGIVIDKTAQTLTVYMQGKRIGSCAVTTGLALPKYPARETPAGEFITVTRSGSTEYMNAYTKYTIRINGSFCLREIPSTKKKGKDFSPLSGSLGQKATRGSVCIAHDASTDGGINAEWIWNMTTDNKKVKVLILDDKDRTLVPVAVK